MLLNVDINTGWTVLIPLVIIAVAAYRWGGWRRG